MNPRLRRIIAVTAVLSLVGFFLGAAIGAVIFGAANVIAAGVRPTFGLPVLSAALGCGALGLVLAPLAAWTLMRHVPLWRALGETALGTALGGIIGYLVPAGSWPLRFPFAPPLVLALIGFVLAAVRLRLAHRARSTSTPVDVEV